MDYTKIFYEFQNHKVKYLVVGGLAVNLNGYPRYTGSGYPDRDPERLAVRTDIKGRFVYRP